MFAKTTRTTIGLGAMAFAMMITLALLIQITTASTSATAAEHHIGVPAGELTWVPFAEGTAQMAMLWENTEDGEYAMLLKLPAGWTPGPHGHSAAYHGVTLQGTWVHTFGDDDSRSLPAGSYVVQPGEEVHNDACAGPEECILFIHQHEPFDYTPATGH